MVAYLIGILVLLATLYFNLVASNKLLYPPVIFTLIWIIIIGLHWINSTFDFGIDIHPLQTPTIIFLVVMNILFSLAVFFSYMSCLRISKDSQYSISPHRIGPPQYKIDKLFFEVLNGLSLIFAICFLRKAILLTASYDLGPFIKELRTVLNYHDGSFGWLKYTIIIVNINFFVRLILFNRVEQKMSSIIFAFLLSIGVAILNTGRTHIFIIIIFAFSFWLSTKKVRFKKILIAGLVMIFFFSLIGFLTEKGADMQADRLSNAYSMFQSFMEYLLGPVTAFQEELQANNPLQLGENSLRFFKAVLYEAHLIKSPPSDLVQQFIYVPFPTNVYTVFSPYYKDFGIIGVSLLIILLGAGYGILYYYSIVNRLFYQYFFLLLIYPLVMTFFQDQYFTLLSSWIQYFIASTLVFGIFVLKNKE